MIVEMRHPKDPLPGVPNVNNINSRITGFSTTTTSSRDRVQSKSILRDPICEALRAQIKTGILQTNTSLEAEIDDLLHGRRSSSSGSSSSSSSPGTTPVLVDNVIILREVPYVSMIEVKYRSRSHLPTQSAASVATPSPSSTTYTCSSSNYSQSMDSS